MSGGEISADAVVAQPVNGDDFTRITGVESGTARRLVEAGIHSYADLAGRSEDEIAKITSLSPDQVVGWPGQANELAATVALVSEQPASAGGNGHHYESFIWRLLLDEDGSIRNTTIQHVQTGEVKRWAAWERDSLLDFIETRAATRSGSPDVRPETPLEARADASLEPAPPSAPDASPGPESRADPANLPTAGRAGAGSPGGETTDQVDRSARAALAPVIALALDRRVVPAADRLRMSLLLDLSDAGMQGDRLTYDAVIMVRRLGGGPRRTLVRESGVVPTATPTIAIDSDGLPPGTYRLDAAVSLRDPGEASPRRGATVEGIMLEVVGS